jgi:hypothetical protein
VQGRMSGRLPGLGLHRTHQEQAEDPAEPKLRVLPCLVPQNTRLGCVPVGAKRAIVQEAANTIARYAFTRDRGQDSRIFGPILSSHLTPLVQAQWMLAVGIVPTPLRSTPGPSDPNDNMVPP